MNKYPKEEGATATVFSRVKDSRVTNQVALLIVVISSEEKSHIKFPLRF